MADNKKQKQCQQPKYSTTGEPLANHDIDLTEYQPIEIHGCVETWKTSDSIISVGTQHNLTLIPVLPTGLTNLN